MGFLKRVEAKLGNMRKPQSFIVNLTNKGNIIVQSDKSIGAFSVVDPEVRDADGNIHGLLNTKGAYFPHLNRALGAQPFWFPVEFVTACRQACAKPGDTIIPGVYLAGDENTGATITEI